MSGIMMVIVCIALVIIGLILGWTIRWLYARFQLSASEQRAERVLQKRLKLKRRISFLRRKNNLFGKEINKNERTANGEATFNGWNAA